MTTITPMLAIDYFETAFNQPRQPRSSAYKRGVLYVLRYRLHEVDAIPCPYAMGSVEADAYFAGCDEGHHIAEREGIPVRLRKAVTR